MNNFFCSENAWIHFNIVLCFVTDSDVAGEQDDSDIGEEEEDDDEDDEENGDASLADVYNDISDDNSDYVEEADGEQDDSDLGEEEEEEERKYSSSQLN